MRYWTSYRGSRRRPPPNRSGSAPRGPIRPRAPCTSFARSDDLGQGRLKTDDSDGGVRPVAVTTGVSRGLISSEKGKQRLNREAPPGFEPGNGGFAIHCLTAWLRGRP